MGPKEVWVDQTEQVQRKEAFEPVEAVGWLGVRGCLDAGPPPSLELWEEKFAFQKQLCSGCRD